MSGGSLDYLYSRISNALNIPYGHYSDIGNLDYCSEARDSDPFHDKNVSELAFDFGCLVHALEWYESSDICEETYKKCLKEFKEKWMSLN